MNWSQKKPLAPGTPDLPLEVFAEIAALDNPTSEAVLAQFPSGVKDARATAEVIAGIFTGRRPPRPAAAAWPTPAPTTRSADATESDTEGAAEPAAVPTPDPAPAAPEEPAAVSLADQLKLLLGGATSSTEIDDADFEDDEIFHQIFAASDTAYDYSTPDGLISPGAPTVTYESTTAARGDRWGAEDQEPETTESVLITWKPLPGRPRETTLYRVIAADHEVDKEPGAGTELVITHGTAFRDTRPPTSGFRHYMVWAYTWDQLPELVSQTPLLLGEDIAIFPPHNIRLAESGGTVNGTWDARPGHDTVRVFHARKGYSGRLDAPVNMLADGMVERSGFSHRVDVRGLTYEYTLTPLVSFRGTTRSGNPTPTQTMQVSAEIQQVELTTADSYNDGVEDRIILEWTAPPTGSVKVYLTDTPPDPELQLEQIAKGHLDRDRAFSATEWTVEDTDEPGSTVSKSSVWPAGWHQVYATPVNIVEERAWVGNSRVLHKVDNLDEPRLIERVTNQLITFDWPGGADLIDVRTTNDHLRLDQTSYNRQGGVRLSLMSTGDTVTLTPVAVYAGTDKKADTPTVIRYPGLRSYSYNLELKENNQLVLTIWSVDYPDANAPHFRLIHNPTRLPLFIDDGDPVTCSKFKAVGPNQISSDLFQPTLPSAQVFTWNGQAAHMASGLVTATAEDASWWVDNTGFQGGYLRLFIDNVDANLPEQTVADAAPSWSTQSSGFGSGAFGGSLSADTVDSTSDDGASTWHAASIPGIVIEGAVAQRLALPTTGRMM